VARRYAHAIFDIASEDDQIDRWSNDLEVIRGLLEEPTLQAFFANPAVPTDQKMRMLDSSLTQVEPYARNFVNVLVENGRVSAIGDIVDAFNAEVNRLRGIVHAHVTTAVRLSDSEEAEVVHGLERMTGGHVVVSSDVDPSILGGFVARIGDRLIDASVTGRLAALRKTLMA
jgi:F-type H+-transporting ATPase subunit delta